MQISNHVLQVVFANRPYRGVLLAYNVETAWLGRVGNVFVAIVVAVLQLEDLAAIRRVAIIDRDSSLPYNKKLLSSGLTHLVNVLALSETELPHLAGQVVHFLWIDVFASHQLGQ